MIIPISLTDFVDFVAASGTPKLTVVRRVKRRGEYDPAADFWKRLRERIQRMHEDGLQRTYLDKLLTEVTNQNKIKRYPAAVRGYKRFLGRKEVGWFPPPYRVWQSGDLGVRVNPELGLNINGERLAVKLYFKKTPLAKRRVDTVLQLMHSGLPRDRAHPYRVAILDVPNARLLKRSVEAPDLDALLAGEAVSFATMWHRLSADA